MKYMASMEVSCPLLLVGCQADLRTDKVALNSLARSVRLQAWGDIIAYNL